MDGVVESERIEIKKIVSRQRENLQKMFLAEKDGNEYAFRQLKLQSVELQKEEQQIRSNFQEQKFAFANSMDKIHDFIDLKGFSAYDAQQLVKTRMRETQQCLNSRQTVPNYGENHIYKIIAHAGKHSKSGPTLKYALQQFLEESCYEYYSEMEHGVFLVRMRPRY